MYHIPYSVIMIFPPSSLIIGFLHYHHWSPSIESAGRNCFGRDDRVKDSAGGRGGERGEEEEEVGEARGEDEGEEKSKELEDGRQERRVCRGNQKVRLSWMTLIIIFLRSIPATSIALGKWRHYRQEISRSNL